MHLNGDVDRAQSLFVEAMASAQAAGDHWFAAYARFNQGYIASLQGRYAEGYEQMKASLALWRTIGDPRSIALGLNFLSPTVIKLGRYEEAEAYLQESLALCTQVGDRWGLGTAYRFLGLAALAQGKLPEAETLIHWSLEVFNEFVTGWDIVRSLTYLGEIKAAGGDQGEARRTFRQALRLAMEVQAIPLALDALLGLADLQTRTGQVERALEFAMCVLHHPASTCEARSRAEHLQTQLAGRLAPEQTTQACQHATSLEVLVEEIL